MSNSPGSIRSTRKSNRLRLRSLPTTVRPVTLKALTTPPLPLHGSTTHWPRERVGVTMVSRSALWPRWLTMARTAYFGVA